MKHKWKSYIYVPILAFFLSFSGMFILAYNEKTKIAGPQQIYNLDEYFKQKPMDSLEQYQVVDEKHVLVEQPGTKETLPKAAFVLRPVNDMVCVFRIDSNSKEYMTTGIRLVDLPQTTQLEIINGKEIADEEALYFFLESHSS